MSLTSTTFARGVIGKVRAAQEDSHDMAELTPNGDVFVVCDGMGGHVGGKTASEIAVRCIIEYLNGKHHSDQRQALGEALQFANMQILGYANDHPELKGMGTTACILLLQGDEAFIAHVGDSRIYLYLGKEKQLHRVTKDHSYVQTLVDAGEITDEEAESHPNKNRILKALGIKPELQPTIGRVLPKNGDIFLICSDGLSGMITDKVIQSVLSGDFTIEQKGESLIDLALEAGGRDNITVELVQIKGSTHRKSVFTSFNPPVAERRNAPQRGFARAAVVVVVALIILFGGAFLWGTSAKKSAIEALGIEQLRSDSTQNGTALSNAEKELAQKQKLVETDSEAVSKSYTPTTQAALKESTAQEAQAEKSVKELTSRRDELSAKIAMHAKLQDSMVVLPWWKFLKSEKNESNNDRSREQQ